MKPKKKRKNSQDSTLRNVRATNKRIAKLEKQVEAVRFTVGTLINYLVRELGVDRGRYLLDL